MVDLRPILAKLRTVGRVLTLVLVIVSAIGYFISLAIGPVLFFSTTEGLQVASRQLPEIPVDIFMAITLPIPLPVNIGVLFASVWLIFVVCMIFAWRSRNGFLDSIRNSLTQSLSFAKTNFLYVFPIVASALLYSTVLIQQFQATEGVQTGNLNFPPQTSPYVILINLAFAPVREEFAFRMTSIGIPLGILLVLLYRHDERVQGFKKQIRLVLLALLSPERAKAEVGYKNVASNGFFGGIGALEWVLIFLTSIVFGAAHYLLGGGWEIGKISTAFLAGFVLALMFVVYGAYASILLHWFFNYYFTILDMANTTYGGLFGPLSNGVEITNLVAGQIVVLVFLIVWAVKVGDYLTMKVVGLSGKHE